jgi:hypothetical protein
MTNNKDSLRQYLDLRSALERERSELQQRLQQIEDVLGNGRRGPGRPPKSAAATFVPKPQAPQSQPPRVAKPAPAKVIAKPAPVKKPAPAKAPAFGRPALSMREVIAKIVAKNPQRIGDIVDGMHRAGYVFKSSNPTNSVGAYLYGPEGKKHFVRADGKFMLRK